MNLRSTESRMRKWVEYEGVWVDNICNNFVTSINI